MNASFARLAAALADRYRIERELGAGGMATVYLAHDIKHDRKVAVKVLRPELAAVIGAERFLAEIRTTANLQHPHILPLFDSGAADSFLFYVMPYVEGISLRDRLTREKQLPIADAVRIAREVADALQYAHQHGIIHRDVKPENILLHGGHALVADFGIALAASKTGGTRLTETGMSLGTPQYMSPEQAMGERELDARSDIYALGCVSYEMLTGEPPFAGPSAQAIVAKVMTADPVEATALRKSIPRHVAEAVHIAMQKLPADRFASASDFSAALGESAAISRPSPMHAATPSRSRAASALVAALIAGGMIGALAGWLLHRTSPGMPVLLGRSMQVTSNPGLEVLPAISPDGRSVAYAAGLPGAMRIYVRAVTGGRAIRLIDDTSIAQRGPSWSPDGTRIVFLARGGAFSAPAAGGTPRPEIPAMTGDGVVWAAWDPRGNRLGFAIADSLFVREVDGTVRRLATVHEPVLCSWSHAGGDIACAAGNATYVGGAGGSAFFANLAPSHIVTCRVRDGALSLISDSTSLNQSPVWSPDGRWVYYVSDRLGQRDVFAQHLSGDGAAEGVPIRVTTGLSPHSISLSPDGRRLAYSSMTATSNVWSLGIPTAPPVSTDAAVPVTSGTQVIEGVAPTLDGNWLYYDSNIAGSSNLFRMRLPAGEPEQLTADTVPDFAPEPSPDGKEVAFHSWRSGSRDIYVMPLDGGPLQRVTSSPRQEAAPVWARDGSALAFLELTTAGGVWVARRNADRSWGTPVQRWRSGVVFDWSPNGKSLLVEIAGSAPGLSLLPVDGGPPRAVVDSAHPGMPTAADARWSADGNTIYFKSQDVQGRASFWSVPTKGGTPRLLVRFSDPNKPSNNPRWGMANNRFYFTIDDWQSDIRVLELTPRN